MKTTIGRGWGQGPVHSQAFHNVFSHFPGLKVLLPSNPYDAKGMIIAAIKDKNPVLFIEHKSLFNTKSYVPKKNYSLKIGEGKIKKKGKDLTIVAFSYMVEEALKAANLTKHASIEVIDMRSSFPLDINSEASTPSPEVPLIKPKDLYFLSIFLFIYSNFRIIVD